MCRAACSPSTLRSCVTPSTSAHCARPASIAAIAASSATEPDAHAASWRVAGTPHSRTQARSTPDHRAAWSRAPARPTAPAARSPAARRAGPARRTARRTRCRRGSRRRRRPRRRPRPARRRPPRPPARPARGPRAPGCARSPTGTLQGRTPARSWAEPTPRAHRAASWHASAKPASHAIAAATSACAASGPMQSPVQVGVRRRASSKHAGVPPA